MGDKNAIILMGLPLSGKSSWIRENEDIYKDYVVVSADKYKEDHPDYDPDETHTLHQWSVKKAEDFMNKLADDGSNVIMDGGGINNSYTMRIMDRLRKNDYNIKLVHIKTPVEVCLERNTKRVRKVPTWAIQEKSIKEVKQFHRLSKHVDEVVVVEYFTNRHIFVDMDGVLAGYKIISDIDGKIDFVNREYFKHLKPVKPVIEKLHNLIYNDAVIYILSATLNSFALAEKMEWLDEHFNIPKERRFFVNSGKNKAEMLENLARHLKLKGSDVTLIDDMHAVLKETRDNGFNQMHISEFLAEDSILVK